MFALDVEHNGMRILAINLDKDQTDAITCELGEIVCTVDDLEQACELVQKEDFTTILYRIMVDSPNLAEITNLVGLTLISTRIILIGQSALLARRNDWRGLGVELLPIPSVDELVRQVRERNDEAVLQR
jgi:hypothetical protein